jgi:hypothetical protein
MAFRSFKRPTSRGQFVLLIGLDLLIHASHLFRFCAIELFQPFCRDGIFGAEGVAHGERIKEDAAADSDEWNGPIFLLLPQPAQRRARSRSKKDFEKFWSADQLNRFVVRAVLQKCCSCARHESTNEQSRDFGNSFFTDLHLSVAEFRFCDNRRGSWRLISLGLERGRLRVLESTA